MLPSLPPAEISVTVKIVMADEQRAFELLISCAGGIIDDEILKLLVTTVGRIGRRAFRYQPGFNRVAVGVAGRTEGRAIGLRTK